MPTTLSPPSGWRVSRAEWAEGYALRRTYAALLPAVIRRRVEPVRSLPLSFYSLSCERDLPEQVASIRALLRHAGRPTCFVVVSDGSLTPPSRRLLAAVDPCVRVTHWTDVAAPDLPCAVWSYAQRSAMGKKLALELSLPVDGATAYLDSDVLCFPPAAQLAGLAREGRSWYLVDCEDSYLDRRLLRWEPEARRPVNAGFFVLSRPLEWSDALARLALLDGQPGFHSEQTLTHLALHAAGAQPLDPQRYVVATDDMTRRGDAYVTPRTVLRHYTSPVRHKFWRAVARRR